MGSLISFVVIYVKAQYRDPLIFKNIDRLLDVMVCVKEPLEKNWKLGRVTRCPTRRSTSTVLT